MTIYSLDIHLSQFFFFFLIYQVFAPVRFLFKDKCSSLFFLYIRPLKSKAHLTLPIFSAHLLSPSFQFSWSAPFLQECLTSSSSSQTFLALSWHCPLVCFIYFLEPPSFQSPCSWLLLCWILWHMPVFLFVCLFACFVSFCISWCCSFSVFTYKIYVFLR